MLVLSRKANQEITFPNLNICVKILRLKGNAVSVGIEAPRDIQVLRGELREEDFAQQLAAMDQADRRRRHDWRNRLNTANLALHVLQKQLDQGAVEKAEATLAKALTSLAELDELAKEPVAARQSLEQGTSPCRALIVEDNENERELLAGFLELCGYEVDAVGDGMAAMEYLEKQRRPDVVLLDMQMPLMDGPATISAIRKHPEYDDIKLFVVSGSDQSTFAAADEHAAGYDQWFCKPINPAEFASSLEDELERTV